MRSIKRFFYQDKGSALIFILLVLVVVSVLGIAIIGMASSAFRITKTDADHQSAYYIAEAGINHTIDFINTKVNDLYNTVRSGDEFFSYLESSMSEPVLIDDFESNFGRTPEAKTTIRGSRRIGENSADYTLTSVGRIGNSTRTVSAVITVNWIEEGDMGSLEDIFIYGSQLEFTGSNIYGAGGTIVVDKINLERNAAAKASNIYIKGPLTLDRSSADIGNEDQPGSIYIDGNLKLLSGAVRDLYGEIYVNGDMHLVGAKIHGNAYINGDLELGWTPQIHKKIYYTGKLKAPNYYSQTLLNRCIKVDQVPSFEIPDMDFDLKDDFWYTSNGYDLRGNVTEKTMPSNAKMVVDSYYSDSSQSPSGNIIIISKGDITIRGWRNITGVLIAPYGKVILEGGSFTGIILAQDGLTTERGGWNIYMRLISDFFTEDTLPITISHSQENDSENGEEASGYQERVVIKSSIKEE